MREGKQYSVIDKLQINNAWFLPCRCEFMCRHIVGGHYVPAVTARLAEGNAKKEGMYIGVIPRVCFNLSSSMILNWNRAYVCIFGNNKQTDIREQKFMMLNKKLCLLLYSIKWRH